LDANSVQIEHRFRQNLGTESAKIKCHPGWLIAIDGTDGNIAWRSSDSDISNGSKSTKGWGNVFGPLTNQNFAS